MLGLQYQSIEPFHNNAIMRIPSWALPLHYPYWKIRVEGRNQAIRRKYYRQIRKIKINLVEQGHDIKEINLICRYLVSYKNLSVLNYHQFKNQQKQEPKQLLLFHDLT